MLKQQIPLLESSLSPVLAFLAASSNHERRNKLKKSHSHQWCNQDCANRRVLSAIIKCLVRGRATNEKTNLQGVAHIAETPTIRDRETSVQTLTPHCIRVHPGTISPRIMVPRGTQLHLLLNIASSMGHRVNFLFT